VNAVRAFIDANPDFKGASVVPLGNAKDSGALHAYFTADLLGTHVGRCVSLEDAKRDAPKDPVIFIDDFVASGGQTRDILGAWFDNQDLRMPLNEDRTMFDDGLQKFLREVKVAFVIVAAWDDGIRVLREALAKVKLEAVVYRHLSETDLPFMSSALADLEEPAVESFLARCREIGRSVLTSTAAREGKSVEVEKLEQRLLGYGNRGMLLASPFNVPSQTLTAIWAHGTVNGVDWQPLLNRRKKK
jgi:deoxynucleoside triphosphate triphosphohydrolase SAMHD1